MNKDSLEEIESAIEQMVTGLFAQFQPAYLIYHNLEHTQNVVRHAREIAAASSLSVEDHFLLMAAAWFHDTGQLFSRPELHEAESVRIADNFFTQYPDIPGPVITGIDHCILATRMPQKPQTPAEAILCDADLYHLGTSEFITIDERVKKEAIARGMKVSGWDKATFRFLTMHHFHTDFCRVHLAAGKAQNIACLRQKLHL